jgi:phospholipid/cholesterol/gamma-HCH transport system permease protein
MSTQPVFLVETAGNAVRLTLAGVWTLEASRAIEERASALVEAARNAKLAVLDLAGVERLDTGGAWLIGRACASLGAAGVTSRFEQVRPEYAILLKEAKYRDFAAPPARRGAYVLDLLSSVGHSVVDFARDFVAGIAFLGECVVSIGRAALRPAHFRTTSLVYHVENFGLRSVPIIALINFLVGCIVAQQGIFQLRTFGAETFAVDLIGILILRELGVLLTSIMIAGRSGSAITAEIGSMKMREEIDAIKVMGLSPIGVLVVPRILALIIAMPILTFLADMSAIFGGLVVSWMYAGLSPEAFLSRLQLAISFNTFAVGLVKAPFMALVIALIGAREGLAVEGSAESLGRQVTASVVKSIFMVIVVDGLFAMFFAAIRY